MKKINKVVGEAKVSMREKMGKKEAGNELPPDYLIHSRSLSEIKAFSKEVTSRLAKQSKQSQSMIEENCALGDEIKEFSAWYMGEDDGNCPPLGNSLRTLGEMVSNLEVARSKMDIAIGGRFLQPTTDFMKTELKEAYLAKSRYDKLRISFDAASEHFKAARRRTNITAERLADAEAELNQVTQEFSEVANDSLFQMSEVIDKYNSETFDRVYDFVKIYQDYFQRGLELVGTIIPDMEQYKTSMQKYRQQVSDRKKKRDEKIQFETRSPPKPNGMASSGSQSVNKVFGVPLTVLVEREDREVPLVVEKSIEYLASKALNTEGVFRVSPNQKYLNELKANVNASSGSNGSYIEQCDDVHVVSAFLKSFLREMPTPLLTFDLYKPLVKAVIELDSPDKACQTITTLLKTLPPCHLALTKQLIELLYKISSSSQTNKMTSSNLAVVLAPNILYPKQLDIQAINDSNATIEFFISRCPQIFSEIKVGGTSGTSGSANSPSGPQNKSNGSGPPRLPSRPQTLVFKQPPVTLPTPSPPTSSAPTSLSSSGGIAKPSLPPSPSAKRLSASGSVLPPTPSTTPSTPPASSPSSQKPINNRVSVYLQNLPQVPQVPPKPGSLSSSSGHPTSTPKPNSSPLPPIPSPSSPSPSSTPNPRQSMVIQKGSLPPIPGASPSKRPGRPGGILVTPGTTLSDSNSKISYSLLDDSVSIQSNEYNEEEDEDLIQW